MSVIPQLSFYNGTTYCVYDGQSTTDWAYGKVGLATSTDNIHWTKASTYLFDPAYVPSDRAESAPQIAKVDDHYNCYYCVYIGRGTYPGDYYELAFATATESNLSPTTEPTIEPSSTPKQTGFLGTSLPLEVGNAILIALIIIIIAGIGSISLKKLRRKHRR